MAWSQTFVRGNTVVWEGVFDDQLAWGQTVVGIHRCLGEHGCLRGNTDLVWGDPYFWSQTVVWGNTLLGTNGATAVLNPTTVVWGNIVRSLSPLGARAPSRCSASAAPTIWTSIIFGLPAFLRKRTSTVTIDLRSETNQLPRRNATRSATSCAVRLSCAALIISDIRRRVATPPGRVGERGERRVELVGPRASGRTQGH